MARYKVRVLLPQIAELVRKKKKIPISLLAMKYNMSRHYFRYNVIKALLEIYDDIRIIREDGREFLVSEAELEG